MRPRATHGDLRWNSSWIALTGALFEAGATFIDTSVVALFVSRLTRSATAVGATEAIARVGWLLPQLVAAHYAQGLRYRKPIYLVAGWGRAMTLGILATVVLVFPIPGARLLLVFFLLWTLFSFVSGLAGVPYNDIVGRTIPSDRRSRLLAGRVFLGGILGVGAGFGIRATLDHAESGDLTPYALIFTAGTIVLAVSTACFALVREPPAPLSRDRPTFAEFFSEGVRVVRRDGHLRLFVVVQVLANVTAMALPFYVLQARQLDAVREAEVGTFVAAQTFGSLALNVVWGWWGDRRGKLSLLRVVAGVSLISPLIALLLPWLSHAVPVLTVLGYALLFFSLGAAASGRVIAELGYLMEISPDDRRPEFSAYANVLVAPSRLLPLVAGAVVELFSFPFLFVIAGVAALVRLALLERLERTPCVVESGESR